MTDIQKLKDDVVEAAKASCRPATSELLKAVGALRAAEEAARKPRLTSPRRFAQEMAPTIVCSVKDIEARDAEWVAAIKGLPRYDPGEPIRTAFVMKYGPLVRVDDILDLVEKP